MSRSLAPRALRQALFAAGFMGLGAAVSAAGGALAGPGGPDGHGGPGAHFVRLIEGLDLNADQQAKLAAVKVEAKETVAEHRAEREADAVELISLIRAGKLSRPVMHQRIDDKLAAMKDGMHELGDQLYDLYEGLNASQRSLLADRLEAQAAQAGEHGGRGRQRGPR